MLPILSGVLLLAGLGYAHKRGLNVTRLCVLSGLLSAAIVDKAAFATVSIPDLGITWADYFTALTTTLGAVVAGALLLAMGIWAARKGWGLIRGFVGSR